MNGLGIFTGNDIREQSLAFLQERFGKAGQYYYWIARGVDERPVRADRVRQSVGAENTFANDLTAFDALISELELLIDKVWRHCESTGTRGRTVTLKVKFSDFEIITRSRSASSSFASHHDFYSVAASLLRNEIPLPKPVRLLGVRYHPCKPRSLRNRNCICRCNVTQPNSEPVAIASVKARNWHLLVARE